MGKVKRIMIKDVIMATWNVRTMMLPGKMQEISNEMITIQKSRIGRPRIRWLEDVITDLRRMGISGWMEMARNRDQWRQITKEDKAHRGL
jgi:hypothetical protein